MSVLQGYFGWPFGSVWSNLLASLICIAAAFLKVRAQLLSQHAEALAQSALHHEQRLAQQAKHHADLKAHIAAHCSDVKAHVNAVLQHEGDVTSG